MANLPRTVRRVAWATFASGYADTTTLQRSRVFVTGMSGNINELAIAALAQRSGSRAAFIFFGLYMNRCNRYFL